MADKDTAQDDDTNIFEDSPTPDDGLGDVIKGLMAEMEDGPEDDGGLDQTFDVQGDKEMELVGQEEAGKLIDKANLKRARGEDDAEDEGAETKAKPKENDAKAADEGDKGEDKEKTPDDAKDSAPDLSAEPVDKLLEGLPDDRRGELAKRLAAAEEAMKPFQNEYISTQMKTWGATPQQVVGRLTELADFAQQKPDEYIAWVATEMASEPGKVSDVLNAAAKHLGLQVVPIESDDDMFEDPEVAKLRRENEALKRAQQGEGPTFGPDAPARRAALNATQTIEAFRSERDETGNVKRPFFDQLKPSIAAKATEYRNSTGKNVEIADLDRFYNEAVSDMRSMFGSGSAATASQPVQNKEQTAASARKARNASKSVDGTGQGATRRPALPAEASLEDTIRHFAKGIN